VAEAAPKGYPSVPGYEILGELGRGAMGVVYKARQLKLKRLVALKMILAGSHAGEADLTRFRIEAEAVARLQHPNIVRIYEDGQCEGKPFFSMEFVEGGGLDQKLQGRRLPPYDAARLVGTLATAMHVAHQAGIVHRDLKPANVLLAPSDRADAVSLASHGRAGHYEPKITDFGLAKRLGDDAGLTSSGAVLGTASYMAPEQVRGGSKAIGPPTDVYALGAILYELVTGRPPFKAASRLDTLLQVLTQQPRAPSRLNSQLPLDLELICLKCLRKEPSRRYGTAAALAEDLARFRAGKPIRARPANLVLGNPRLALVMALIALALSLLAVKLRDAASGPESPGVQPPAKSSSRPSPPPSRPAWQDFWLRPPANRAAP
jgi:serine/threonine-protein kinase